MRLLAVADLHYSLPQFDWVLEVAPDFDVVVLAGDHARPRLDGRRPRAGRRGAEIFRRLRANDAARDLLGQSRSRFAARVAARRSPDGSRLRRDDGIITDGKSFQLDGILVHRLPVVGRPDHPGRHRRATRRSRQAERQLWIWIHHAPPDKSPTSWGGDALFRRHRARRNGSCEYKPDIVLSGHVHQSPFVKDGSWVDRIGPTWVFNAGQQFGAPPTHIIIDTDVGEALWFSSAGNQYDPASASRSSGRCRGSKRFPTGSKPRIGLGLRAGCEFLVLLVDQASPAPRRPCRDDCRGPRTGA